MNKVLNIIFIGFLMIGLLASCAGNSNKKKDKPDKPVERFWGHPTDGPGI